MVKQSSYKKLKAENLKLKQDLIILATEPESGMGLGIRTKWCIVKAMEIVYWQGEIKRNAMNNFNGLLPKITNG